MKKIYFLILLASTASFSQCVDDEFFQPGTLMADRFQSRCFNSGTPVGVIEPDVNGHFLKSPLLSITTTGTGAATYNTTTRVLNIPTPSITAPGTDNASAYSSGTIYTLTTTSQKIDFGTTDPVITLPSAGTYLLFPNLKIQYNGLTTLLNTCNFKLRRTNNTAADLPNATTNFDVVATLLTGTGGDVDIPVIKYTTTNNNDVIEMWGNRQSGVSITGSIQVGEASITAVRIY